MLTYQELKSRQRRERASYTPSFSLRLHRALSWLKKAEQCDDDDAKFIFLWIAFNAAYAQDFEHRAHICERGLYQSFLRKLVDIDTSNRLFSIVWSEYSGPIRVILDNEFILQAYWDYNSGRISETRWKTERSRAKVAANKALGNGNTAMVLSIVFARLYTLRNQIIHGGASYASAANRSQVRDCSSILEQIVPVIIAIMMDGKADTWGEPAYPLIAS